MLLGRIDARISTDHRGGENNQQEVDAVTQSEGRADVGTDAGGRQTASSLVLLSPADVVRIYGVSRSFAYGLKRWIPFYKFGGLKFRRSDIERFLELERRVVPQLQEPAKTSRRRRARAARHQNANLAILRDRYGM